MKILLTSTSFQDTPGEHHELLKQTGFEVDTLRGPVKADVLLPVIDQYDGVICSDDEYNEDVIRKGAEGRLKAIAKYGVGLDSIDLRAASHYNIKVTNCELVNHITVAEHVMALIFTYFKNIHLEYNHTIKGEWKRLIGHELFGKTIGIAGLGKIGKEVAVRAKAFGLKVMAFDKLLDEQFLDDHRVTGFSSLEEMLPHIDILSLNLKLTEETTDMISRGLISEYLKKGTVIVNTARGKLVDLQALIDGLKEGTVGAYLTDVLEVEPMAPNHPLKDMPNVIITPHIGSRTYESVERQGIMAVHNLVNSLT
jgi:D-3-phosphoglycerate dehydrogenase